MKDVRIKEHIIKLNKEIDSLEEYKDEAEVERGKLLESIESLMSDKKAHENTHTELKHQINKLLANLEKSEKKIEQIQRNSSINDIEIEPKIYLKGMFNSFDKDKNILSIFIDAKEYFYPLDEYQCAYLPLSGSRVFIFKSEENKNLVYGFDVSKMIESSPKIKAEIKHISKLQGILKLHIQEYGYVNFTPKEDFFALYTFKIGAKLLLKRIFIDGDYHFCIEEAICGSFNRNQILLTLQGDNF